MLNDAKYIGLDVHQATISVVVLDCTGHLVMESIIETKAATILQFLHGLSGSLHLTFEEGTCAAWLHDLLKPHVAKVVVCDPRKNALLKAGNKNDRIDARKLADLLRSGLLSPVYHGENGIRTLKELARSYLTLTRDATRVMNRLKALYIIGVGRLPAQVRKYTHRAIAPNGSPRSPKPVYIAGRRSTTSSWTHCGRCASKYDETCWRRAANIAR
jgi:transposase